ncbi:MAG: DUF4886 domain-containing protein [Ruminococcaceae bacterium]|nr:DUF4886 domain-containing protein [Oscillospiraceae bacterium]
MKKLCIRLSVILLFAILLPSCSPSLEAPPEEVGTKTGEKDAASEKNESKSSKEAEQKQDPKKEIMQKCDPAEDEVLNILMIGNSYCYYYVEELYGIAKAAGIDMKICNVYYSGCPLDKHLTWWRNGESNYQYFETNENGRIKYENYSLRRCLDRENWDVITLQEGNGSYRRNGLDGIRKEVSCFGTLLDIIKEQFPKSRYYWHCTWVPQIGNYNASSNFRIETKEDEMAWQNAKITIARELAEQYGVSIIPTGQAWMDARYNPVIGNKLCLRKAKPDDTSHDGDIGGGQYLNACVWFEMLTGKSCIGNTWRPNYELSEEKIAILQQAAHKAVVAERG